MERVVNFLKECGTYFLATQHDGQPEVRPFGTATVFEGKLLIQTGRSKAVYREIIADPKVSICAWDGKGTWLRVNAVAVEDARDEASAAVLEEYPSLKGMYAPGDGNCTVFALTEGVARFCSFTAAEETVEF